MLRANFHALVKSVPKKLKKKNHMPQKARVALPD
jgi:hypothetical protein